MLFKLNVWEEISVWQKVTILARADSIEDLKEKVKSQKLEIEEVLEEEAPDWCTQDHLKWDSEIDNIEILEETELENGISQ